MENISPTWKSESGNLELFNCDCMEVMARYPDKHFDLAIVDPPYGIGDFKNSVGDRKPYNRDWKIEWNDSGPDAAYFQELYRVSKNLIVWGVNYYAQHVKEIGRIVWDKGNSSGVGSDCELASQFKDVRVVKYYLQNIGFIRSDRDDPKIHPCQKPVALYNWLLANYAKRGQTILDTHLGSGSSAIACHYAGCPLVACEIDLDYFNAAVERVRNNTAQTTLFDL